MSHVAAALARTLLVAAFAAVPARAELYVWIDAEGRTHVTDDAASVPPDAAPLPGGGADVGSLWGGLVAGPQPRATTAGRSDAQRRQDRIVQGALDDLRRGESARAAAALEAVLRDDPRQPEAHWYLADLDRRRGRLDSAARHLSAFLAHAGDAYESWRDGAQRRLRALEDERRLAAAQAAEGPLRLVAAETQHFRVHYDARLGEASPGYARTVLRFLDEAHRSVVGRLGVAPREQTGVVLYAKAAYLAAHRHRFSFPTVGFFDGRIHVASSAHPEAELRSLLFHEFTHAVFAERTGGDRPFWLNEGLAELSERSARGESALARSERAALGGRIESGGWIPLARLAPGFGGLGEAEARAAYLEATAAAAWLEARLGAAGIASLLDAIGAGQDADVALRRSAGVDTAGLDTEVRRWIAAEFPAP
ncbi:MAG: hypothetical protein DCC71_19460 [Proteobacteria bacterium]|nr:MAG: hypothetical protein DCC71_19460 [Pseudomonadota bacterium]